MIMRCHSYAQGLIPMHKVSFLCTRSHSYAQGLILMHKVSFSFYYAYNLIPNRLFKDASDLYLLASHSVSIHSESM